MIVSIAAVACGHAKGDKAPGKVGAGRGAETVCKPDREPGTAQPGGNGTCQNDAECTSGKNGRCRSMGDRVLQNTCTYDTCFKDADCTTGGPCECDAYRGNYCLAGNCRTDADCGAGGSCGRSNSLDCRGGGAAAYYCRTAMDACASDSDCKTSSACLYASQVGHWTCQEHPVCPPG